MGLAGFRRYHYAIQSLPERDASLSLDESLMRSRMQMQPALSTRSRHPSRESFHIRAPDPPLYAAIARGTQAGRNKSVFALRSRDGRAMTACCSPLWLTYYQVMQGVALQEQQDIKLRFPHRRRPPATRTLKTSMVSVETCPRQP